MPSVVPTSCGDGPSALGRAGWADAATIVPWAVHVAYADTEVLAAQLPSMRALVSYLQGRRQDDGLLGGEFQFGDWLDPDAPGDRPHEAKTSSDFLANAFLAHSARLVARAADRPRRRRAGRRVRGARRRGGRPHLGCAGGSTR